MELEGRVALVTGGASGIGRASAGRLARAGCRVVVADVDAVGGRAVAAATSGRFAHLDVTDPAGWAAVVDGIREAEGRLDVAHLNAGVATGVADVTALDEEAYRRVMAVNVDGVVFGVRACAPAMAAGGAIVATASLAGLTPMPMDPVYSATKHAVVGFVRSVAPAFAERGITVNAVCPGFADTRLFSAALGAQPWAGDLPLVEPDAIAEAVLTIVDGGDTGDAWFVQPGRPAGPYAFRGVPGPRVARGG